MLSESDISLIEYPSDSPHHPQHSLNPTLHRKSLTIPATLISLFLLSLIILQFISPGNNTNLDTFMERHMFIDGHVDWIYRICYVEGCYLDGRDLMGEVVYGSDICLDCLRDGKAGVVVLGLGGDLDGDRCGLRDDFVEEVLVRVDLVKRISEGYSEYFELGFSHDDLKRIFQEGKIGAMISLEGGHLILNRLSTLRMYYDLGVRVLILTDSCNLQWAESYCNTNSSITGLSRFGTEVIAEMNRIGMVIDLSHASERTMIDVLSSTKAPVIFSRTGAHTICNVSTNIPDNIIDLLKDNKGLIMISANTLNLCKGTLNSMIEHIQYIVDKIGIEYVGIGTDLDSPEYQPIKSSMGPLLYKNITNTLLSLYSEEETSQIIGGNYMRILKSVEEQSILLKETTKPSEHHVEYPECR